MFYYTKYPPLPSVWFTWLYFSIYLFKAAIFFILSTWIFTAHLPSFYSCFNFFQSLTLLCIICICLFTLIFGFQVYLVHLASLYHPQWSFNGVLCIFSETLFNETGNKQDSDLELNRTPFVPTSQIVRTALLFCDRKLGYGSTSPVPCSRCSPGWDVPTQPFVYPTLLPLNANTGVCRRS